jgi:hypothetical protein
MRAVSELLTKKPANIQEAHTGVTTLPTALEADGAAGKPAQRPH